MRNLGLPADSGGIHALAAALRVKGFCRRRFLCVVSPYQWREVVPGGRGPGPRLHPWLMHGDVTMPLIRGLISSVGL